MRQLLWMAEGHARDEWNRLSTLLALTANCHRDPKKGRALRPDDFDPFGGEPTEVVHVDKSSIGLMKQAFMNKAGKGLP